MSGFGARLKELREAAGVKVHELAARSGVFSQQIYAYEGGKSEPVWSSVVALARALDVPLDAFLPQEDSASTSASP